MLGTYLRPVRERAYHDDRALSGAASEVRDGLAAVTGWPEGLERILRRVSLDGERLLKASELRLEQAPHACIHMCIL